MTSGTGATNTRQKKEVSVPHEDFGGSLACTRRLQRDHCFQSLGQVPQEGPHRLLCPMTYCKGLSFTYSWRTGLKKHYDLHLGAKNYGALA